jgi:hypothetical protein
MKSPNVACKVGQVNLRDSPGFSMRVNRVT